MEKEYTFSMAPKKPKEESFVTQSQWAEGMEMIKDFFGKLFSDNEQQKRQMAELVSDNKVIKKQIAVLASDNKVIKKQIASLEFEVTDARQEQRRSSSELEAKIELTTESVASLSKDVRHAEKVEFNIYNHEGRITKLEKARYNLK